MADLTRRQVTKAAAWSVPVIAVASAAPATAASDSSPTCPAPYSGPVTSWLSSDGFTSYGDFRGGAAWYVSVHLNFQNAHCGFGSDYAVSTDAGGVVAHFAQGGRQWSESPTVAHTDLNSFTDAGLCGDALEVLLRTDGGAADLYVTQVSFTYLVYGLSGDTTAPPCSVPITATLTYPSGAPGNDAEGTVVLS